MRVIAAFILMLLATPALSQISACTNAGLVGMQAQLCPIHANANATLTPGGQVSLSTLQGIFTASTANGGVIPGLASAGVITPSQSTALTNQAMALTNTAASLRSLLLAINTAAVGIDDQPAMVTLINGALPTGSTLGISADTARRVIKEVTYYALKYNVGMNLGGTYYFDPLAMFADIAMQAAGSSGYGWDNASFTAAPLDTSGAPTACGSGSCSAIFSAYYPSGNYTASWTGTGTLSCGLPVVANTGNCVPQGSPSCSAGSCTQTFLLTQETPTNSGWTAGDPGSGYNDHSFLHLTATTPITNIHVVPQNANLYYQNNPNSPWLKTFFQQIAPFKTIRFMDLLAATNDLISVNWRDRRWPTTALANLCTGGNTSNSCISGSRASTSPSGTSTTSVVGHIAYEDIINVANTFNKDVWINVPQFVTDNYVCRLFRLLAYGESGASDNGSNCSPTAASVPVGTGGCTAGASSVQYCQDEIPLGASHHVYIEECNEPWNMSFQCYDTFICYASNGTQAIPPDLPCPPPPSTAGGTNVPPSLFAQAIIATTAWQSYTSTSNNNCSPLSTWGAACISNSDLIEGSFTLIMNLRDWNFAKTIYGQFGTNVSQIRIIYGGQAGQTQFNGPSMAFVNGNHAAWAVSCNCNAGASISFGDPGVMSNWLYGLTEAPYQALTNPSSQTATVPGIFTALTSETTPTGALGVTLSDWANNISIFGVQAVGYEGGQGLGDTCSTTCLDNEVLAQPFNTGGQSIYAQYMGWYPLMASLMPAQGRHTVQNVFNHINTWDPTGLSAGTWGSLAQASRHGSHKLDGLYNLTARTGDVNLDGTVDENDRAIICGNIGATLPASADGWWWMDGDLNHDGAVNSLDLALYNALAEGYNGATCP